MPEVPSPTTVSHPNPPTAGADRADKWKEAITFEEFLPTAEKNVGLWKGIYKQATIPGRILERVAGLDNKWKLLILSADWCGDASNIVPVLQRLVDDASNLELRLLDRDEHMDLMDEHLTGGVARSIPAVIILDKDNVEHAWWGPRPSELQKWVKAEGHLLNSDERYRESRKWYARDKGNTSLDEVVSLLEESNREEFNAPPVTGRDHIRGDQDAPVTLIHYGDYQSSQSHEIDANAQKLLNEHPGELRFVFRHFPLRRHEYALPAAEASEAAGSQHAFWEMHDRLYEHQLDLRTEQLVEYADAIGLDAREVEMALSEEVFRSNVLAQKRLGKKAGISSARNLIVNGRLYQDDDVIDAFKELEERMES